MTDPDDPPSVASTTAAAHNPYYPHEDAAERDAARDRLHHRVELEVAPETERRLRQLAAEEFDVAELDAVVRQLLDEHQESRGNEQQKR